MARNVEIKARLQSLEAMVPRARSIADDGPVLIEQDDTFFGCPAGRLKLRAFAAGDGELIFYRRADTAGPKTSFYLRTPTADPDGLRDALALACGIVGRVRKRRMLFLVGRTRIHLDRVEGLGDFLELEVVLADDEPAEAGVAVAHALMGRLGVDAASLVATAYIDLLAGVPPG
jgi:adenylate cyclase class IV